MTIRETLTESPLEIFAQLLNRTSEQVAAIQVPELTQETQPQFSDIHYQICSARDDLQFNTPNGLSKHVELALKLYEKPSVPYSFLAILAKTDTLRRLPPDVINSPGIRGAQETVNNLRIGLSGLADHLNLIGRLIMNPES